MHCELEQPKSTMHHLRFVTIEHSQKANGHPWGEGPKNEILTLRPIAWGRQAPPRGSQDGTRRSQESSKRRPEPKSLKKPPYCQHFFIKSLKTTILSAFSRPGRAVGAQPGTTKKCSKRTRPHRGWDTSGVQNFVFMNIDPHQTL